MGEPMLLTDARKAYRTRAWAAAYAHFRAVDEAAGLELQDLERLGTAAYLTGSTSEAVRALQRAHLAWLDRSAWERAARCACSLGFILSGVGDGERARGWFRRAVTTLEAVEGLCVEHGYVLMPEAIGLVTGGDTERAFQVFSNAVRIGERFADRDLIAFARHGQARALLRKGDLTEGLSLLDEAMVSVEAGEISPIFAGIVYCSAIEACSEISDVRRARAWTRALDAWCESQQGLVPYRGECLIQRSRILLQEGAWEASLEEAERACGWLTAPVPRPAAGAAHYQLAELYRLRGDFGRAEDAYARAAEFGRSPQPGLALLRIAQGHVPAARQALERALEEALRPAERAQIFGAMVEAALAHEDLDAATHAAAGIDSLANEIHVPTLRAQAEQARGEVRLRAGEPREALAPLRRASEVWLRLGAAYEAAWVGGLIGLACGSLGDRDTGELHLAGAKAALERLGAAPALERLERWNDALGAVRAPDREVPAGLTPRELEVLRLVSAGDSNRRIGDRLGISERTVERHVSNIFDKAGVSSRAAATAFAYENDLL